MCMSTGVGRCEHSLGAAAASVDNEDGKATTMAR